MKEVWKDIPNYEGVFQASTLGRIKKLAYVTKNRVGLPLHKPEKVLKLTKHPRGYIKTRLYVNANDFKPFQVHRLIALTFIGAPPNGLDQVNHINGIKHDNRVENLEWCNNSQNQLHSNANGFRVHIKRGEHRWAKTVLDTVLGISYTSVKEAWEASGYPYRYDHFAHQVKANKLKYKLV